jgi:excisionase family DNA binding protein
MGEDNVLAPGWVMTDEAAEVADYSVGYVQQLAKKRKIEAKKLGRVWLINKASLEAYKAGVRPGRPRQDASQEE